jgi:hypothetical protein
MLRLLVLFGLLMAMGCTKKPHLKNFDALAFKGDKGGCKGLRASQIASLKLQKDELKAVLTNDIGAVFGKPDIERLDERNQKYYIYFLQAGPHCRGGIPADSAFAMRIRFSALGLATEVAFSEFD